MDFDDEVARISRVASQGIARRRDGTAKIVALTESHSMLVVRVSFPHAEPVTLMCGACERIESNARWTVGRFYYDVISADPYRYRLTDALTRGAPFGSSAA